MAFDPQRSCASVNIFLFLLLLLILLYRRTRTRAGQTSVFPSDRRRREILLYAKRARAAVNQNRGVKTTPSVTI